MCSFPHKKWDIQRNRKIWPGFDLFLFPIDEKRDSPPYIVYDSQTQHLTPNKWNNTDVYQLNIKTSHKAWQSMQGHMTAVLGKIVNNQWLWEAGFVVTIRWGNP